MENKTTIGDIAVIKIANHGEGVPSEIKVYKCPYIGCDKYFTNSAGIYLHRKLDHGEIADDISSKGRKMNLKREFQKDKYISLKDSLKLFAHGYALMLKEKKYFAELEKKRKKGLHA